MMSVRRMPNLSLTTTTSPCAISVPLTSTSIGSPARPSSSTTEPCASCSRLRIDSLVRPSSTVSCTGMSRIMSKSFIDPARALPAPKSSNRWLAGLAWYGDSPSSAAAASSSATRCASASGPASAAACSAMAAAQSSSVIAVSSVWLSAMVLSGFRGGVAFVLFLGDETLHPDCVMPVLRAEAATDHGNPVDFHRQAFRHVEGNDVADPQVDDVAQGHLRAAELRRRRHVGRLQLVRQQLDPAVVLGQVIALHGRGQDGADAPDHRVRLADVHLGLRAADLEREGRRDDDLRRRGDV